MNVNRTQRFPIKMWNDHVTIEDKALDQLKNTANLPFIHKWVAAMPDTHWGLGATVGSVVPTHRAIIPAAVGVDIGCGMMAMPTIYTASDLPDNLAGLRTAIEAAVPHGRTDHGGVNDEGGWQGNVPADILGNWKALDGRFLAIKQKHPRLERANTVQHLGTLGTGNHFIEICLDETQRVWIMLHSGSRGIGNAIGRYFIELAKEDMRTWFINVPDADLAYFPEGTDHFTDYVEAMLWAQDYASVNRQCMLRRVTQVLMETLGEGMHSSLGTVGFAVNCHHNYAEREHHYGQNVWVTRKGAVRAREGDMGIIPGSMGARSYIVRGKGNPESFHSCSHGAGRLIGRKEAERLYTVEDHIRATEGVECRKDAGVVDETPMAYKNIDDVMASQADLVEIVHTLKQVVCVKG